VPVPSNPNGGWHNGSGSGWQKHVGASVETRPDGADQCWWLMQTYGQTGNIDWLNSYRQCLSLQYSD
jgi:hypothetical protein